MAATVVQTPSLVSYTGTSLSAVTISFSATPQAGNTAIAVYNSNFNTPATWSSTNDNQSNVYNTTLAWEMDQSESYNEAGHVAYCHNINSSGTFTISINLSASTATWGHFGALEVADLKNQAPNVTNYNKSLDISTNDPTISATTTAANCWVLAAVYCNVAWSAHTLGGATSGYTSHYNYDGDGAFLPFGVDSKSVTSTGSQSATWALNTHDGAQTAAVVMAAFEEATYQNAYPTTDTTRDNWEEDDGTTTNIYDQIDETTADDADYIRTQTGPSSDVYVTKFTSLTDPASSSGHTVSVRYGKDSAGGDTISLVAQLRQGYTNESSQGTLIATALNNTNISANWTTASYTLSGTEADSITDYGSLYLRLVGNREAVGYSLTPPSYRGAGGTAVEVGSTSVDLDAVSGSAEGDLLLAVVESSDSTTAAGTPNTPTDWTKIFEDTEGSGATNVTTLTVFARLAPSGGTSSVTIDGVGDHVAGRVFAFTQGTHGVTNVSTDLVVGTASKHGTTQTGCSTSGITVTANSMVVLCIGLSDDANDTSNASGYSNSNLANISERSDQTFLTGAGGGIAVMTATCAGTTTGATTWNHDTAVNSLSVMIGIRPVAAPRRAQVSWARFRTPEAPAGPTGSATGKLGVAGSVGTIVKGGLGTSAGRVGAAGAAAGKKDVSTGAASGRVGAAGSAVGKKGVLGTSTGAVGSAGAASGQQIQVETGSAAGAEGAAGSAAGKKGGLGAATGREGAAGSATGKKGGLGAATGREGAAGSAAGGKASTGAATGAVGVAGSAYGTSAAVENKAGSAFGQVGAAGSAAGKKGGLGSALGQEGSAGSSVGGKGAAGSALGQEGASGSAAGVKGALGGATGAEGVAGSALGTSALSLTGGATGAVGVSGSAVGVATFAVGPSGVRRLSVIELVQSIEQQQKEAFAQGIIALFRESVREQDQPSTEAAPVKVRRPRRGAQEVAEPQRAMPTLPLPDPAFLAAQRYVADLERWAAWAAAQPLPPMPEVVEFDEEEELALLMLMA